VASPLLKDLIRDNENPNSIALHVSQIHAEPHPPSFLSG